MSKKQKPVNFQELYKDDWAVFCQAISEMYTSYIADDTCRNPPAPLDKKDLNFFNPESKLFYLPWGLYSAGQAAKNDKMAKTVDMVSNRNMKSEYDYEAHIVGDSGGFQIETGTIKWEGNKTKERMLRWLENNCDWSMILDFPTGCLEPFRRGPNSLYTEYVFDENGDPVMTQIDTEYTDKKGNKKTKKKRVQATEDHILDFWFCLDRTMENNDYFMDHRDPGKTKFLNVLQGRYHDFSLDEKELEKLNFANRTREEQRKLLAEHKISEVDAWYESVKKYSQKEIYGDRTFEGWALAGNHKNNFDLTLRRIVIMLYDGLLADKDWMHFLGMGQMAHSCVYTVIQKGVRAHSLGSPGFTISHDASSGFSSAGAYGLVYHDHRLSKKGWSLRFDRLPDGNQFIGSKEPLITENNRTLLDSPLARMLTMGDLCINESPKNRCMDKAAYAFLMHHNCYYLQKAIVEAQALFERSDDEIKDRVPTDLLTIKHILEDVFNQSTKEKALEIIRRHGTMLRKMSIGNDAGVSLIENSDMFDLGERERYTRSAKSKPDTKDEFTTVEGIIEF